MTLHDLGRILSDPRHRSYLKLAMLAGLVAASLLPLQSIRGLIAERQATSDAAEQEIVGSWGGAQRIVGPVLVVPLAAASADANRLQSESGMTYSEAGDSSDTDRLFILPETLSIDTEVRPQVRRRGIYETMLYTAKSTISGSFAPGDLAAFGGVDGERLRWQDARIEVYALNNRGIIDASDLDWNGVSLPFEPGDTENSELVAALPALDFAPSAEPLLFSFGLELKGSRSFGFSPLGGKTAATLRSSWPHPSFYGGFPPVETRVSNGRLEARWENSRFERELKGAWLGTEEAIQRIRQSTAARGALVALIFPVDHYLQSERSVKYGVLFVILVSCVLFVFEIVSGARVHPIQYGMVAAALCLFFLLLVSLSEAVGFGTGYLLAAALTIGLLSYYIAAVFGSRRRGAALAGLLAVVYGYMYLVLLSEDHALLLGSLLLFAALAGAMVATRRLDWYAVGGRLPARADSSGGREPPSAPNS